MKFVLNLIFYQKIDEICVKLYLLSELNWIWNSPLVHSAPYLGPLCITIHHPKPHPEEHLLPVWGFSGVFLEIEKVESIFYLPHPSKTKQDDDDENAKEGWWWSPMQRRRYSLQRVSFGSRRELKRFLVKRGFSSAATNPTPSLHLLRKNTSFEVQQNFSLKIQLKICYIVGETNLEFCSLYFMLFDGRKVFNLPFNRVNWPQGDFRNLSHSPNTGFHLWAQLELNQYSTHLDWSD